MSKLPKMVRDQVDAETLRDVTSGKGAKDLPTATTGIVSPNMGSADRSADLARFEALGPDGDSDDSAPMGGAAAGGIAAGEEAPLSLLRASAADVAASAADEQVENLRSMFIAMAEDWRIVVVKLADRLHNMRTLDHMPPAKQAATARETLQIFAPLAHRLGMWQYKTELSDLSFKYLFPVEFNEVQVSAPPP